MSNSFQLASEFFLQAQHTGPLNPQQGPIFFQARPYFLAPEDV